MGPINNIPALVQTRAWRRSGDIILSNGGLVYWRIYASPAPDELTVRFLCHGMTYHTLSCHAIQSHTRVILLPNKMSQEADLNQYISSATIIFT